MRRSTQNNPHNASAYSSTQPSKAYISIINSLRSLYHQRYTAMIASTLILRKLMHEDEESFKQAVAAFKNETPPWEFAFDYDEKGSFSDYVDKLNAWSQGDRLPEAFVQNSYYVGVVNNVIVGRLSIRHFTNDFLEKIGGHIGYGVVPAFRKRGYATEMLTQAIPISASIGINNVLITCDTDNISSRRVIEKCGGVFEGITNEAALKTQKRRYWIATHE